jgi:retron-type reverse transcriptase
LQQGYYCPLPVKRVEIPKPNGGIRLLGIPSVHDRVIQQAITQVLQPLIDPDFSDHSHGAIHTIPGVHPSGQPLAVQNRS